MQDRLDVIIENVLRAVRQVRAIGSFRSITEEILDAFWCLQDQTHQLVGHIDDHPSDIPVLSRRSPTLIPAIVDVLSQASKSSTFQIPAVANACDAVNRS